jgi:diguanylate cyclase (GGDEF)-like protein/PAS domain S-box-containing protein
MPRKTDPISAAGEPRWGGFATALLMIAAVAVLSFVRVERFQSDVDWNEHTHEVIEHIGRADAALLSVDLHRLAYRLSRDKTERLLMDQRIAEMHREIAEVERLTKDNPRQGVRIENLRPLIADRIAVMYRGLDLPRMEDSTPKEREAERAIQSSGLTLAKRIHSALEDMGHEEQELLGQRQQRSRDSATATRYTILFGTVLGMALITFFYGSLLRENRLRVRAQKALEDNNVLMSAVLEGTTDSIAVKDRDGRYVLINPAGARVLRHMREEILGRTNDDFLSPETARANKELDLKLMEANRTETSEQIVTVENETRVFLSTKGPYRDAAGNVIGTTAISRDITDRKQMEERIKEQAIRDPLTSLYNRRYLDETLERELSRTRRKSAFVSVIMIDIDHFKRLNDTHGHAAGDEVLRRFAKIVLENVRREDVPCRYGGEEFAVVLPELSLEKAVERAERLRGELGRLALTFDGKRIDGLSASFGVATSPQHGLTGEALLSAADAALYRAKAQGRDRVAMALEASRATA